MAAPEMSTVVSSDVRRFTIVNLKQVNELPLRNVLQTFDKNGDGKIDITELQKIVYWYGLWKYASFGLCLIIMTLVWSTFGLTIWAINLTKDYSVTDGVLTGGDEVVKMSVASTHIPLSWATLLDRRHLDALESLTIDVTQGSGKFSAGVYHMKVASYLHANSTYLKLFGADGSRVWVNSGTVVLHHPDAEEAVMVCGAAACNTLAVDVKPEYLQQLVQRSAALIASSQGFELPATVDGVTIHKAAGEETCQAALYAFELVSNAHAFEKRQGRARKDLDAWRSAIVPQAPWAKYPDIQEADSLANNLGRHEEMNGNAHRWHRSKIEKQSELMNINLQDNNVYVIDPETSLVVEDVAGSYSPIDINRANQIFRVVKQFNTGDADNFVEHAHATTMNSNPTGYAGAPAYGESNVYHDDFDFNHPAAPMWNGEFNPGMI